MLELYEGLLEIPEILYGVVSVGVDNENAPIDKLNISFPQYLQCSKTNYMPTNTIFRNEIKPYVAQITINNSIELELMHPIKKKLEILDGTGTKVEIVPLTKIETGTKVMVIKPKYDEIDRASIVKIGG